MYDTLTSFLRAVSAEHPIYWAFLVTGVVAAASLVLYALWELVLRMALSSRSRGRGVRR